MPERHLLRDTRGATAIEYALIAALIAIAAVPTVIIVGSRIDAIFMQAGFGLGVEARN